MKRTAFLLAFLLLNVAPLMAQANRFGILIGGSKRVIDQGQPATGSTLADPAFSLSNQSIELFYGVALDEGTMFKIKAGRIEGPIALREREVRGANVVTVRRDVEGEVQHVEGIIEYRFSEIYGSTAIFGGLGAYRQEANNLSSTDYGWTAGVNADFPLSRRYGVIVEGAYHWTKQDFEPGYLTLSAGLRIAF